MDLNEQDYIIDMRNIDKGYFLGAEKVPVLKQINFQVKKGEFVAILGPSGSGKTTLMNMIGCMDVCDSGEYYLEGQPIHIMSEKNWEQCGTKRLVLYSRIISLFRPMISCRISSCLLLSGE